MVTITVPGARVTMLGLRCDCGMSDPRRGPSRQPSAPAIAPRAEGFVLAPVETGYQLLPAALRLLHLRRPVRGLDAGIQLAILLRQLIGLPLDHGDLDRAQETDLRAREPRLLDGCGIR